MITICDVFVKNNESLSLEGFKILASKWLFQYSDVDKDNYTFEYWYDNFACGCSENILYMAILRKIREQKGKRELRSYLNSLRKCIFKS